MQSKLLSCLLQRNPLVDLPNLLTACKFTMGNFQNILGAGGELLCGTELLRPIALSKSSGNGFPSSGWGFLFDPVLFGGKEPTYDYLVYLLDANKFRSGPFFFLQVKTTMKKPAVSGSYSLDFSATDVARAQATKVPFFVAIVDRNVRSQEKIYLKGVASTRTKGMTRLSPTHDLSADAVKVALYNEVSRLWQLQQTPVLAKFI